jgi:hypothetical protein
MSAHAGSRTRVTSMGGLYDAATLHALCLPRGTFPLLPNALFEGREVLSQAGGNQQATLAGISAAWRGTAPVWPGSRQEPQRARRAVCGRAGD